MMRWKLIRAEYSPSCQRAAPEVYAVFCASPHLNFNFLQRVLVSNPRKLPNKVPSSRQVRETLCPISNDPCMISTSLCSYRMVLKYEVLHNHLLLNSQLFAKIFEGLLSTKLCNFFCLRRLAEAVKHEGECDVHIRPRKLLDLFRLSLRASRLVI